MKNNYIIVGSEWMNISTGNKKYVIQNKGKSGSKLMVFAKETTPVAEDEEGGFILDFDETITSDILTGTIWVKSLTGNIEIAHSVSSDSIEIVKTSGAIIQEVPDMLASELASNFTFSVDGGDFINTSRSSNGQQFVEISIDPLSVGETQTIVEFKRPVRFPLYAEIEASLSQRTYGDYAVMEITDKVSRDAEPIEYNIVSISQSTTTLTVTLDSPFDGWLGSWVDIYGLADSRFNYTSASIATMSLDKKTLTITTRDEVTIPSLTATPASFVGGKLKKQAKLQNARNAVGMRFTGLSATTAAFMARFDGGSIKEAGTLTGARLATNASTAPTYTSGVNGNVEIKPSSRYRIEVEPEIITFMDKPIDNAGVLYSTRQAFTAVKP